MGCKAHFRNITATRFPSGGGIVRYNMMIDRCAGIVQVWQSKHRTRAEIDLPTLARMVMDRWAAARAREAVANRKKRRLVKRGLLGCPACGG